MEPSPPPDPEHLPTDMPKMLNQKHQLMTLISMTPNPMCLQKSWCKPWAKPWDN